VQSGTTGDAAVTRSEHPTISFFRQYWESKRAGRAMPSRHDIVASELREHLGWVVLLDVLPGAADFRYRLVGTLVAQYFLYDGTGKTVTEAFRPETPQAMRESVLAIFRKVATKRRIVSLSLPPGGVGPRTEACDVILMPLSDDGVNVNVILEAFVFDRSEVLLTRQIARANGGILPELPLRPLH
jgi:hypothetical protein